MLSLVTLEERFDFVWAVEELGAQSVSEKAPNRAQSPWNNSFPRGKWYLVIELNSLSPFI
jgi:hypothetical protein